MLGMTLKTPATPASLSLPGTQIPRGSWDGGDASLPAPAVIEGLAGVERSPQEALEQGLLFPRPDARGTRGHVTRCGPGEQGPHRVHLALEGGRRLQHLH